MHLGETPHAISSHPNQACSMQPPGLRRVASVPMGKTPRATVCLVGAMGALNPERGITGIHQMPHTKSAGAGGNIETLALDVGR